MMARLNRVPMEADRITAADHRFEVVKMDGRRVDRVLVSPTKSKSRR
jgi:CBS domain containing-hemolysin-like protein